MTPHPLLNLATAERNEEERVRRSWTGYLMLLPSPPSASDRRAARSGTFIPKRIRCLGEGPLPRDLAVLPRGLPRKMGVMGKRVEKEEMRVEANSNPTESSDDNNDNNDNKDKDGDSMVVMIPSHHRFIGTCPVIVSRSNHPGTEDHDDGEEGVSSIVAAVDVSVGRASRGDRRRKERRRRGMEVRRGVIIIIIITTAPVFVVIVLAIMYIIV